VRTTTLLLMLMVTAPTSHAQQYTITDLGTLSGYESRAFAINDRGDVVGESISPNFSTHAFLWTRRTGMRELTPTDGAEQTAAYGVSATDEVALYAYNAIVWNAVDWEARHVVNVGSYSVPQGINSFGTMAGYSSQSDHAFQWTKTGGLQDLGTLGGPISAAFAINDSGQIVGYSAVPDGGPGHAFLWSQQTGMQDLGTLGQEADAHAISSSGMVAGVYWVNFNTAPFLWTPTGGLELLPTLPNAVTSTVGGINDAGQVVGCALLTNNTEAGFLWTRAAGVQDLSSLIPNTKGFTQVCPTAINARGEIAAVGLNPKNRSHALLLTPISPRTSAQTARRAVLVQER